MLLLAWTKLAGGSNGQRVDEKREGTGLGAEVAGETLPVVSEGGSTRTSGALRFRQCREQAPWLRPAGPRILSGRTRLGG